MRVLLSELARADLVEIGSHIGRDSPGRAAQFVARLKQQCEALQENFFRHPVHIGSENDSIRRAIYREYIIFYRVETNLVSILRIVHGARNLDVLFDP